MHDHPSVLQKGVYLQGADILEEMREISKHIFLKPAEVASVYNISLPYASMLISQAFNMGHKERARQFILSEHTAGRDVQEISNLVGMEIGSVVKYLKAAGISNIEETHLNPSEIQTLLSRSTETERREINAIISGTNICEIGEMFGYSRENARLRIRKYGLEGNWNVARNIVKGRSSEPSGRQRLLGILKARKEEMAKDLSLIERKAVAYAEKHYVHDKRSTSFEDLYGLFRAYLKLGEHRLPKISDITQRTQLGKATVEKIFERAGLLLADKEEVKTKPKVDKPNRGVVDRMYDGSHPTFRRIPPKAPNIQVPRDTNMKEDEDKSDSERAIRLIREAHQRVRTRAR